MRRTPWASYLWPGLPQLWSHGAWSGLFFAIGFAALVNLAIATTFVWPELFTAGMRNGVWAAVCGFWVVSAVFSWRWHCQYPLGQMMELTEGLFRRALEHYLKGDWFEAEHVLAGLLKRDPWDVDAGLMLATLLRHRRRFDDAALCLARLERLEGSEKWAMEIRRERRLLEAGRAMAASQEDESPGESVGGKDPGAQGATRRDAA